MEGRRVLVDGFNLQMLEGTGIKTYSRTLIKAIRDMGAEPNVLISRYGMYKNKHIHSDIFALFQAPMKPWLRYNYSLIFKSLLGLSNHATTANLPKDMIIFKGREEFNYIQEANIFVSPNCYQLADYMYYLKRRVKILVPDIDIWHTTYFTPIEIPGAVKITTIHDLIPLRLPYTTVNDKGFFVEQVQDAIRTSQKIVCVSHQTARDLEQFFSVPKEKLVVAHQPTVLESKKLSPERINQDLRLHQLSYKNYLLFVGAIEPKKNLRRLIKAYLSSKISIPLAIVGKKAWLWDQELEGLSLDRNKQIKLVGFLTQEELQSFYQGACSLIFPSLYEGYGLPVLEAMNQGCPVITSNTSSLPEIGGDAVLYVDPYDMDDIAEKMRQITSDKELRQDLTKRGLVRSELFSRANYQAKMKQIYESALK